MARRPPNKSKKVVRVGTEVWVRLGGRVLRALAVEDRGNLGICGKRIVRVEIPDPEASEGQKQFEIPVDWLQPVPA